MLKKLFLLTFFSVLFIACGSSGGSDSGATVRVLSPSEGSVYAAGDTVEFTLETIGFTLAPPFDRRSYRHNGEMHATEEEAAAHEAETEGHDEMHGDEGSSEHAGGAGHHSDEEHSEGAHGDDSHGDGEHGGHDHDSSATNPTATEGHYHVYLNDASGRDPHVTAWTHEGQYELPVDIEPGTHTLRFELRDNNHVLIGGPNSEAILFFEVE